MREITIDATTWRDQDDFYDAVLSALGGPVWHGRNLDALSASLRDNDINEVKLPLQIRITGATALPPEFNSYLREFAQLVDNPQASGTQICLAIA